MRYHNITKDDMLNGDGLRVVLWVAGCSHCCKGCQNPVTWDPNGGLEFDDAAKEEIFDQLSKPYISGITFSGGDPLHAANRVGVRTLMTEIHEKFPNKTIWLYTGDVWENVMHDPVMKYVNVLVDGEYVEELRDTKLRWKQQPARDRCAEIPPADRSQNPGFTLWELCIKFYKSRIHL